MTVGRAQVGCVPPEDAQESAHIRQQHPIQKSSGATGVIGREMMTSNILGPLHTASGTCLTLGSERRTLTSPTVSASLEVSTSQPWGQVLQSARGLVRAEDSPKVTRWGVRLQDP